MVNLIKQLYQFEQFQMDVANRLLLRNGETVAVAPKVFDLLLLLVERSGDVLEKDELMKLLWPDTFVEDNNLTVSMSALRKALGDGKEGVKFIETIPRRGYRFVAQVRKTNEFLAPATNNAESFSALALVEPAGTESFSTDFAPEIEPLTTAAPQIGSSRQPQARNNFLAVGGLLLMALVAGAFWWGRQPATGSGEIRSIAVLPLKSFSVEAGDELFNLGMADALITRLSNTGRIVVRPTSAIAKYGRPDQDPLMAGRELAVDAVLEGRILRVGQQIRITVQLLRLPTGDVIGAWEFDEMFTNILALQKQISEKVALRLTIKLNENEQKLLAKNYTENTAAFEAYLKGRYFWNKRTPDSFPKAIEYFNQAIELDPTYALAYAGLADVYVVMATPYVSLNGRKGADYWDKAKATALKALEIDDSLAEAHASLGAVYASGDDVAAHREFERAIELNPNYATVYNFYAVCLIGDAKLEEALVKVSKAHELDPLSVPIVTSHGVILCRLRRPDDAIAQFRKAEELDPSFARMHWGLGMAYEQKGSYDQAISEFQKAVKLSNGGIVALASLGHAYGMAGRRTEAQQILGQLLERNETGEKNPYYLAAVYAGLGEKENAFAVLEKNRGNFASGLMKNDHLFDALRSDPRFEALVRK